MHHKGMWEYVRTTAGCVMFKHCVGQKVSSLARSSPYDLCGVMSMWTLAKVMARWGTNQLISKGSPAAKEHEASEHSQRTRTQQQFMD